MTAPQLSAPKPGLDKSVRLRFVKVLSLLLFAALFVNLAWVRNASCGLWILGNITLYWVLVVWGLMRFRSMLPAFGLGAAWSGALALVLAVAGFSYAETFAGEYFGFKVPAGLVLFGTIATFLALFPFFFFGGFAGAAAGGWLGAGADPILRVRTGTGAWYLISLPLLLGAAILVEAPGVGPNGAALLFSAPALTALCMRWMSRTGTEPALLFRRFLDFLSNRLIVRVSRGGRPLRLDLRGAALGLLAGLVALLVGASEVLTPLQSVVLVSLIRARNEPLTAGTNLQQLADRSGRRERRHILLLTLDQSTRREAMTASSEIAVQIKAIRRLREWGVNTIVLPAPLLSSDQIEQDFTTGPPPREEDVERNQRDLPKLEALLREARNVVVGLPETRDAFVRRELSLDDGKPASRSPELMRLARAARRSGQMGAAFIGAARLPSIPTDWRGEPPLPLVAAASIKRLEPTLTMNPGGYSVHFADNDISEIAPHRLLVDFLAPNPAAEFTSLTYSGIQAGEYIYDNSDPFHGKWVAPKEYLAGKTVFLDALRQPIRETPIGSMPMHQLMASATATLLSSSGIRHISGVTAWALTLFLGWWTGVLCGRRNPVIAGWRAAGLGMLVFLVSTAAFLLQDKWIDPVVPALAVLGSFALATQLTFEVERAERARQRSFLRRLVGPELVEEYLDNPEFNGSLGGTRKEVCVVFADVRNFTRFAEHSSPEEVIEVTNRYLGAMTEAIMRHGGILDKYTGDGLMAFFQNSVSAEKSGTYFGQPLTVRAVNAAIEMQRAVTRVSEELSAEGRDPLRIGVGLHYGEAVVGLVGHSDRSNYTAIGHTVVVSQRLQSIASGGEVIISESVYRSVHGMFSVEPGEPVQVKGLSDPVRPYRVSALPVPGTAVADLAGS